MVNILSWFKRIILFMIMRNATLYLTRERVPTFVLAAHIVAKIIRARRIYLEKTKINTKPQSNLKFTILHG